MTSENHQKVIITGAATGIGAAMAKRFAGQGASLVLMDLNQDELDKVVSTLTADGSIDGTVSGICVDVSDAQAVASACERANQSMDGVNVLINNAAAYTPVVPITELSVEQWQQAIDVNLTSAFLTSKAVIPIMQAAGKGVIINVASQLGSVASTGRIAYCASKGGIIQFTKALALDHAKDGIRVVSLSPGAVLTNRLTYLFGSAEKAVEALAPRHPIGRLGDVNDVACAATYLASDEAAFMTGSDLLIDGGYNAQ